MLILVRVPLSEKDLSLFKNENYIRINLYESFEGLPCNTCRSPCRFCFINVFFHGLFAKK